MTNWTLDKARGLPLASLFRIVDESSREEGMLLIEQILSGEIDGGREHSKLVLRHDGSSVPVTWWARRSTVAARSPGWSWCFTT